MDSFKSDKEKIDRAIKVYFDEKLQESSALPSIIQDSIKAAQDFCLSGGKRIRPILFLTGYRIIGELKDESSLIRSSLSIEFVQSSLLIHDDIMDQDDLRRGKKTVHAHFRDHLKGSSNETHYGESMAIMIGDILMCYSYEVLSQADFPKDRVNKCITLLSSIINFTNLGQILDLNLGIKSVNAVSEEDILLMERLKTAYYTIDGPIRLGAILAGASESELSSISKFAIPLGQAFQLQDDILGVFGDELVTGKPVGSDLKEGKKTLLLIKALEKAGPLDTKFLLSILGKPKISNKDLLQARSIIKSTGALDYVNSKIDSYVLDSRIGIDASDFSDEAKNQLLSFMKMMLKREK